MAELGASQVSDPISESPLPPWLVCFHMSEGLQPILDCGGRHSFGRVDLTHSVLSWHPPGSCPEKASGPCAFAGRRRR